KLLNLRGFDVAEVEEFGGIFVEDTALVGGGEVGVGEESERRDRVYLGRAAAEEEAMRADALDGSRDLGAIQRAGGLQEDIHRLMGRGDGRPPVVTAHAEE